MGGVRHTAVWVWCGGCVSGWGRAITLSPHTHSSGLYTLHTSTCTAGGTVGQCVALGAGGEEGGKG